MILKLLSRFKSKVQDIDVTEFLFVTYFAVTETIWSSKSKEVTPTTNDRSLQPTIPINEDPNNFFTFRDGVIERAVRECINQFLDPAVEGPLYASFLLTQ